MTESLDEALERTRKKWVNKNKNNQLREINLVAKEVRKLEKLIREFGLPVSWNFRGRFTLGVGHMDFPVGRQYCYPVWITPKGELRYSCIYQPYCGSSLYLRNSVLLDDERLRELIWPCNITLYDIRAYIRDLPDAVQKR